MRQEYEAARETVTEALKREHSGAYLVLAGQIAAAEGRAGDRDKFFREARARLERPAARDDFNLDWAATLGQMLPDQEVFSACDRER